MATRAMIVMNLPKHARQEYVLPPLFAATASSTQGNSAMEQIWVHKTVRFKDLILERSVAMQTVPSIHPHA
ncbi:MAG: hypothetical protein UY52_C0030G0002 [Parcubacteria group bacterium GW2011_GWC2_49_9]|nr:MAG: hypothetical protein UY52_C0030G0002 [Parcubacteria group bacterium GW2011_GWC2_49_9]